jgi:hypothetical protein
MTGGLTTLLAVATVAVLAARAYGTNARVGAGDPVRVVTTDRSSVERAARVPDDRC